jgi:hypothetical protein
MRPARGVVLRYVRTATVLRIYLNPVWGRVTLWLFRDRDRDRGRDRNQGPGRGVGQRRTASLS